MRRRRSRWFARHPLGTRLALPVERLALLPNLLGRPARRAYRERHGEACARRADGNEQLSVICKQLAGLPSAVCVQRYRILAGQIQRLASEHHTQLATHKAIVNRNRHAALRCRCGQLCPCIFWKTDEIRRGHVALAQGQGNRAAGERHGGCVVDGGRQWQTPGVAGEARVAKVNARRWTLSAHRR